MREIEFRGKNKDIGWVYGQLVFDTNKNPYIVKEVEQDSSYGLEETMLYATMWYRVESEIVGQYTGLKDKNGVKIYEGDIVIGKCEDLIVKGKIIFDETTCSFIIENILGLNCCFFKKLQVLKIGNIYDNPELLEKENTDVK